LREAKGDRADGWVERERERARESERKRERVSEREGGRKGGRDREREREKERERERKKERERERGREGEPDKAKSLCISQRGESQVVEPRALQGLLEIKNTHRPRVLPKAFAQEHRTTLEAVRVLYFEQPL
jgi:hypothetical protein